MLPIDSTWDDFHTNRNVGYALEGSCIPTAPCGAKHRNGRIAEKLHPPLGHGKVLLARMRLGAGAQRFRSPNGSGDSKIIKRGVFEGLEGFKRASEFVSRTA